MPTNTMQAITTRLETLNMHPTTITWEHQPVIVARRSDFKLAWIATRLHTFVYATQFDTPPDRDQLDRYLKHACQHAINNKGGLPRGLQTGIAAIGIAITPTPTETTTQWATRPHARWAAVTHPALTTTNPYTITHPKHMLIGGIYSRHLKKTTRTILGGLSDAPSDDESARSDVP